MVQVTPKPPVYEARQVEEDNENSDWVLVNVNNPEDVVYVSNEEYQELYEESSQDVSDDDD